MIAKLNNGTSVIIEIKVLNRQTLDKLALYNTTTDGTKLMIEELHKGFQPVIYFIEMRTLQLSLDQLKNLYKPC
ncbi:hypothetical protein NDI47_08280 [Microcoleus vaginatus GB1-A2]|uniref:hypothetical protein n=1 Tax=Microcoleus vaginatus TaxID=119532 RepID=UPI0016842C45|nr:hypothetical protein [Microcoleus sp. FACHB-61]